MKCGEVMIGGKGALTSSGFRYWLLFINDYSRYFWIYLAQHGIRRGHTVKASPQQNGVAERLNRTLEELLVAMLNGARLPARFWGEGLSYLRHVIVRSPSSSIPAGTTPYEEVHKRKPDYSPLRVFGCRAWAHIQRKERKASRSTPSRASSSAVRRTSKAGSCGTRLPTADAVVSSSRATLCGTRRSSPACRASHTTPSPSASVALQSLVTLSAHQMMRRSLTRRIRRE
jgi:hypothetical protein